MSSSQPLFNEQLVVQFDGWLLVRLPTDPDPCDEPRGSSGYSFAFGNEPDLDRCLHLQPPAGFQPRSYSPTIGVHVRSAIRTDGAGNSYSVDPLVGAAVNLLGNPKMENRNWVLTLPGFEPIVPFILRISTADFVIERDDILDPANPGLPVWEVSAPMLQRRAAFGLELEPETIGRATGIWDSMGLAKQRMALLQHDLEQERRRVPLDPARLAILHGRIQQLQIGINAPPPGDRRIMARYFVERFGFQMNGPHALLTGNQAQSFGGVLDPAAPWTISFWMGAWDPDVLCCFMQGSLCIPYKKEQSPQ
jgi:hypothetical protein